MTHVCFVAVHLQILNSLMFARPLRVRDFIRYSVLSEFAYKPPGLVRVNVYVRVWKAVLVIKTQNVESSVFKLNGTQHQGCI